MNIFPILERRSPEVERTLFWRVSVERRQQAVRSGDWKLLIDDGRMLDGEDYLKATGRRAVVLVPAAVLDQLGVQAGSLVTLSGPAGSVVLPVAVADLPDGVVWAPASSGGINLVRDTGAAAGSVVRLAVTTDGGVA
jgi:NADH-quinone oxidoreductase subunit G